MEQSQREGIRESLTRRQFLARSAGIALAVPSASAILAACSSPKTAKATSLRVGWSSEPDTMNPLTTYSTEAQEILQLVYDKLIEYDTNLKPEPGLAQAWHYSSDGLDITYRLRPGVRWHDGQAFSSDDVKFTFDLIHAQNLSEYAQWLVDLTGVETPDANTVVLRFAKPQAFNPGLAIPILPKHIWGGKSVAEIQKFANQTPIGTGPFRFVEWKRGESVTVKRNADWWGDPPAAAQVIWVVYGNEDVMAQGLRAGEVDILTEVPPTIWDGLSGAAAVQPVSLPSFSFHHIGINVSASSSSGGNPLLLDTSVRQALSYAVDRNQLVQLALAGHGKPGSVLLPPAFGDWQLQIAPDEQMNGNPDRAKRLLDQAGYVDTNGDGVREAPDGTPLEFRLIAIESTTVDVRAAELFRDAARAVGIKLDLQTMDENTLGNTVYNAKAPDWDIFVWGWDSGVADPDYLLGIVLTSQIGGNNDVYYSNARYDRLYDKQATTIDEAARTAIVHEMQQMFYDSAAYIIMWYQDKLQAYRTDTWNGWTPTPGGMVFNFTRDNYLKVRPV
jgi:peptide/nickel transport system substrate-binding protein